MVTCCSRKRERKKDILTSSSANMTHETKSTIMFVYPLLGTRISIDSTFNLYLSILLFILALPLV